MSEPPGEENQENDTSCKGQKLPEKLREWANNVPEASGGFRERIMDAVRKQPVPHVPESEHPESKERGR